MQFEGKALTWYEQYMMGREEVTWEQFVAAVASRFDELKGAKIIADFMITLKNLKN